MTSNLSSQIASLLFEDEGSSLDFKSTQYAFPSEDIGEKAELLKDILAFANAWRRTDAFIIIGVGEQQGDKARVLGVNGHLAEADIQQFVTSKTNRVVDFSYHTCQVEEMDIDVIRIPVQDRPTYLLKRYGPLAANAAFVRRGSSTVVAQPEEIARMGVADYGKPAFPPDLTLSFLDARSHEPLGSELVVEVNFLVMPDEAEIPDYSRGSFMNVPIVGANADYYRELAKHLQDRYGLKEVQLLITNTSDKPALDVKMELRIEDRNQMLRFRAEEDLEPWPYETFLVPSFQRFGEDERKFNVRQLDQAWIVEYSIGKVQPRARIPISGLFVGATKSCSITLPFQLFADNLPKPLLRELQLTIETSRTEVDSEDLRQFGRPE